MAKTVFQKNQRVWVEAVGAWANVEKIVAIWAKGFDEPVRVTYDVGLHGHHGRIEHVHGVAAGPLVAPLVERQVHLVGTNGRDLHAGRVSGSRDARYSVADV